MTLFKSISIKIFKLSIFFILITGSVNAQQSTYIYKNFEGKDLSLDVYEPAKEFSTLKKPAIILFHGGGLVAGNRQGMKDQCTYFSDKGIVAISPSYHLISKDSKQPALEVQQCIKDTKSAIRWIKAHADQFGIDTNFVILGGGSAGAFLATVAAFNNDINESSDDINISVKGRALVLYNPAYVPETRYSPAPVNYVSGSAAPPSIFFFGSEDKFKPGGDKLYNRLAKEKVITELWVAKGEKHSFFNKEGWKEATNHKAYNFLIRLNLLNKKQILEDDMKDFILDFQKAGKN